MKRPLPLLIALAVAALLAGRHATSASATTTPPCPTGGTPSAGSVIRGGLEVDGFQCNLTGVTVYGGITIDGTDARGTGELPIGYLSIDGSTVYGGITVNGGGIDVGVDNFDGFDRTFNPTTIYGGLHLTHAAFFTATDATIRGGVMMDGVRSDVHLISQLCASEVFGNVTIRDLDDFVRAFIGDPGEPNYFNGAFCDANTIHGSVSLINTPRVNPISHEGSEIEGNTVTGSMFIDHSTAEVWANAIGGSLFCTNGTIIQPPLPDDPSQANNTVNGLNTCT